MSERRSKDWVFTSYDVNAEPFVNHRDKIEYLIYGREVCPTTSRPHLQGYVSFKVLTKFSTVRNYIRNAHLETMRGSRKQASEYCKKDGNYQEYGTLPADTGPHDKYQSAIHLASAGKVEEVRSLYPGLYLRYKRTLESLLSYSTDELDHSWGIWICGPPRCGKDYGVRKNYGFVYSKPLNKWWDGYKKEDTVLISDVEPFHASWLGYFLKIWTDRYKFMAEIKCGTITISLNKLQSPKLWT